MKGSESGLGRLAWRIAFVIALALTGWASLVPVTSLPPVHLWDKVEHAVTYAALTALLLRTQWASRPWVVAACVMFYGIVIEFAQARTSYRSGDWHDALANLVGVLSALCTWYAWRRFVATPSR